MNDGRKRWGCSGGYITYTNFQFAFSPKLNKICTKRHNFGVKEKKVRSVFFSKKQFPKKKMQENFYTRLDCFVLRNVAMLGMISRRLSPIGAKLYLLPQFTKAKNNCQVFLSFLKKKSLFFFTEDFCAVSPCHFSGQNQRRGAPRHPKYLGAP